jgi:hypothetical protein
MTDIIAHKTMEAKADSIVNQLRFWGYKVIWREIADDQIVVAFDFMHNPELPWVRAFRLEGIHATPQLFEKEINDWKKDMKARISKGDVSGTLHSVIVHFGAKKLHRMLMERSQ